jgi:hypothetical protein
MLKNKAVVILSEAKLSRRICACSSLWHHALFITKHGGLVSPAEDIALFSTEF